MTDNYNFVMTLLSTIDSERCASHEIEKLSVVKCIFEAQRKKDIQSTIFSMVWSFCIHLKKWSKNLRTNQYIFWVAWFIVAFFVTQKKNRQRLAEMVWMTIRYGLKNWVCSISIFTNTILSHQKDFTLTKRAPFSLDASEAIRSKKNFVNIWKHFSNL